MVDRIGHCRIVSEIGSGGMAVVYKAIQEPLGRTVAVKALKPSIAVDSQFAKRFEREAHFMASLQHENILHVHDFIKERGTMYIIMEYVEGIDLYDLLERAPRLPTEVAAIITLQIARALDYAHFRGIIHRDIKPANIMISRHGVVKLMDFGIARDDTLSDLTETGTGLGTPSYMSPEQILGDKLDARSDIFSLGIVMYQMVTGRKPFLEDDTKTVMQKIRLDRYTSPRRINHHIPRALERILGRCMEKMPANRYPTTQSLIDDLTEFLAARVAMNHNARLVMFLKEVDLIGDLEADEILATGAPRGTKPVSDKKFLRTMAVVQCALLFVALIGGSVIQVANDTPEERRSAAQQASEQYLRELGKIKFVVNPWAHVFIDGKKVATTPTNDSFPIGPGEHYVQFKNPFFETLEKRIVIKKGSSFTLRVQLKRKANDADMKSDPQEES